MPSSTPPSTPTPKSRRRRRSRGSRARRSERVDSRPRAALILGQSPASIGVDPCQPALVLHASFRRLGMRRLRRSVERSSTRRGILRRLVIPTLGVGLLVASSTPALAQATDKEDVKMPGVDVRGQRNGYKVDESTNSKLPDTLQDTPQSITVIPLEVMREQSAFSLRDALRNVTGVSIAAGEGGGAQGDNLTLRGFSARNDIFVADPKSTRLNSSHLG